MHKIKKMRLLIILLFFFNQTHLWACECSIFNATEQTNLEYEILQNDWIGIGTIVSIDNDSYPVIYKLKVRITYKGSNQITEVHTGLGGPDCGFVFNKNQEYIIYGSQIDKNTIETNRCRRTSKIDDSIDYDYLNDKFKGEQHEFSWSESITNFIQSKSNSQIDITNPPTLINEKYEIMSIEDLIHKHPNHYKIKKIVFGSGELKRMKPRLRNKTITNGIIIIESFNSKIRRTKLIKELNKQIK